MNHQSLSILVLSGIGAAVICLLCPVVAWADLPSIRFDQLAPLGGEQGSEFEVEVKGAEIEGPLQLLFDHPGLSAVPVDGKERWFKITVSPEIPVGTYEVFLSGRFGVSNPRLLAICKGLSEVTKENDHHSRETPQALNLNVVVNGRTDGNREDFYSFTASKDQRIWIDCQAQRLLSELDAVLTLMTPTGQLLASSSDVYGQDPAIDFMVPTDGQYVVEVHDLSYRGGQPYRLMLTNQPQVEMVFPAAAQAEVVSSFTALGRNLGSVGGSPGEWLEDGKPLDQLTFSWKPDDDLLTTGSYRFRDHPTHHSVLPTAATCTLTGQQISVPGVEAVWSFPPVLVTSNPVTVESEDNNTADGAQQVSLPLTVAGRFDRSQDADWYQFTVDENGPFLFNVYGERLAGRADPYLVITDDQGNRINELDDFGHRINGFDGHLRDPSQEVNLNGGKTYRVLVQDRYQRGGPRYHYVLEVLKAPSDFFPAVIHASNQNPAGTTVFKGTATYMDIVIHHRGNSRAAVTFTAENLPPGLHVAPTTIPNDTRGTLVLWADSDATDWTGPIQLFASTEVDGMLLRREVRSHSRTWNNSGTSLVQRHPMVAIREQGPFDLRIEPAEIEVEAGKSAELTLQLTRLWPDFKNKVSIQPQAFPGNFKLGNFDINPDQASAPLKIDVQENTRPGRYTLTVMGQGQVPFNKDPNAADKPQTLVSTPARPVTIVVREKPKP